MELVRVYLVICCKVVIEVSQMVISQPLVNKFEWNNFHFVTNLIAFKMNTNLDPGDENPIVCFF